MKYKIRYMYLIILVFCSSFQGFASDDKNVVLTKDDFKIIPYYVLEFLSKLNIDMDNKSPDELRMIAINKKIKNADVNRLLHLARFATDSMTSEKYFKITKTQNGYIIEKQYPLINYYCILSVYIKANEAGDFVSAYYGESVRY